MRVFLGELKDGSKIKEFTQCKQLINGREEFKPLSGDAKSLLIFHHAILPDMDKMFS